MHCLAHLLLTTLVTTAAPGPPGPLPRLTVTDSCDTIGWAQVEQRLGLETSAARRPEEACSALARSGLHCLATGELPGMALGIVHDLGCRVVVLSQWYYYRTGDVDYGSVDVSAEMRACRFRSDCVWEVLERYTVADPDNLNNDYQLTALFSAGGTMRILGRQTLNGAFERIQGMAIPQWQAHDTYAKRRILAVYVVAPSDQSPLRLGDRVDAFMDRLKLDGSYRAPRLKRIECRAPPALPMKPPTAAPVPAPDSAARVMPGSDSLAAADTTSDTATTAVPAPDSIADTTQQSAPDTSAAVADTVFIGEFARTLSPEPAKAVSPEVLRRLEARVTGTRVGTALYFGGQALGVFGTASAAAAAVGHDADALVASLSLLIAGDALQCVGPPVACGSASGASEAMREAGLGGRSAAQVRCWSYYVAGWACAGASFVLTLLGTADPSGSAIIPALMAGIGQDVFWTAACVSAMRHAGRAQRAAAAVPVSVSLLAGPGGRVGAGLRWDF